MIFDAGVAFGGVWLRGDKVVGLGGAEMCGAAFLGGFLGGLR